MSGFHSLVTPLTVGEGCGAASVGFTGPTSDHGMVPELSAAADGFTPWVDHLAW